MAGKFKAWLEGYLDSVDGEDLGPTDIANIRARMARTKKREPGFTDEEVANVKASTLGGIDRTAQAWWKNPSAVVFSEVNVTPKSDPTAVPSTDDVVEELKQQYQKTTL